MRKLLAITLLAFFGLPFATSLLALTPKSEANIPACCRKNGRHHCLMSAADLAALQSAKPTFSAQPDACPYMHAALLPSLQSTASFAAASQANVSTSSTAITLAGVSNVSFALKRKQPLRGPPALFL